MDDITYKNVTLVWNVKNLPDGAVLSVTWTTNPYNPERTIWTEGSKLTLGAGKSISLFVTITDNGIAEGDHSFSLQFVSV
jgi:hypothetical protein